MTEQKEEPTSPVLVVDFVFSEIKKTIQTYGWEDYQITFKFSGRKLSHGFQMRPAQENKPVEVSNAE